MKTAICYDAPFKLEKFSLWVILSDPIQNAIMLSHISKIRLLRDAKIEDALMAIMIMRYAGKALSLLLVVEILFDFLNLVFDRSVCPPKICMDEV